MAHSRLEQLPGELLNNIFAYLDSDPPSVRHFNRRPQEYLINHPKASPLKSLSACSLHLRLNVLQQLFRHVTLRIGEWEDFLAFCTDNCLQTVVRSVNVVIDDSSEKFIDGAPYSIYYVASEKLLDVLSSMSTLCIRCAPADFHLLTGSHAYNVDAWTFNMPWHTFQFKLDPKDRHAANQTLTPAPVFEMLPWTEFCVNEGSFLRAYTQYEYFLRQAPTILIAARSSPSHGQLRTKFLETLRSFSYTAIFPFYNHLGNVLNLIETSMPNLHSMTICLAPHPDEYDLVSAQEIEQSSGKIDFHDAWMELETAYELVSHVVRELGLKAKLRVFKSVDWTFGGEVRSIVEERIIPRLEPRFEPLEANHSEGAPALFGASIASPSATSDEIRSAVEHRMWQHCGGGIWKTEGKAAIDYPDGRLPDPKDLVV